MQKGRIDIITMGCSKNLVDSERLMKQLQVRGYEMHHDSTDVCGEIAVVNTCGFIGDAKEESIEMILKLVEAKNTGKIRQIYVMGCLSERYREELARELPEVDAFYGKFDWDKIISSLPDISNGQKSVKPWERILTGTDYSAYLKISEGCNRFCAYCAIPLITGRHSSRPLEEILEETKKLTEEGVTEFNIIAQDLSAYGTDIYGKSALAELIDRMADIKGVKWIRLHYAYPVDFPYDVLEVMRRRENVCKYLDIALQHISDKVLGNMRRHITKEETLKLLRNIRKEVPEIRLRTTLMTGFPGEGEEEFEELMNFVKEARFDRLGVFPYSEEEGTYGALHFKDDIPQKTKEHRRDLILNAQKSIAQELNEELIGRELTVLVDRIDEGILIGRTEWDSPEVDNEVQIPFEGKNPPAYPGEYVEVVVTDAFEYDILAKLK